MMRRPYDDADFDDQLALVDDVPFTGILFSTYADGSPETELSYSDGLPDGLCRYWYPDGQLERRWVAVRGRGASRSEEWHRNGQPKRLRINDADNNPVEIHEWDERGQLVRHTRF